LSREKRGTFASCGWTTPAIAVRTFIDRVLVDFGNAVHHPERTNQCNAGNFLPPPRLPPRFACFA